MSIYPNIYLSIELYSRPTPHPTFTIRVHNIECQGSNTICPKTVQCYIALQNLQLLLYLVWSNYSVTKKLQMYSLGSM